MAYQFKTSEKAVGAFIITALACLVLVLVYLARNQFTSRQRNNYHVFFNNADNLDRDIKILYRGYEIGRTTRVSWEKESDRFRVDFYVLKNFETVIRRNTVLEFADSLMGGGNMLINRGSDTENTVTEGRLYSSDDPEGKKILAAMTGKALPPKAIDKTIVLINDLIKSLDGLILMLNDNDSQVGMLLKSLPELMKTLEGLMEQAGGEMRISKIMKSLNETMDNFVIISEKLKDHKLLGKTKEEKKPAEK